MQDTEVDLFPSGTTNNAPQTPPRNDHLNATAPGELSPPRSQGDIIGTANTSAAVTNGHATPAGQVLQENNLSNNNGGIENSKTGGGDAAGGAANGIGTGNASGGGTWQPGEWKGKKSQEEAARAWDFVVDREWSAAQYGDVIERGKRARGLI